MSSPLDAEGPQQVANRVLRRAQISKMTRALQDRLALANVKIKHGWQNRSIDSIEPEIERELKRKRTISNVDALSDTSSNASGQCFSSSSAPMSSPLTAPIFSDEIDRSGSSTDSSKRFRKDMNPNRPVSRTQSRNSTRAAKPNATWKTSFQLPESSPTAYRGRTHPVGGLHRQNSLESESSTILNTPSVSEDDDQDVPLKRTSSASAPTDPIMPSSPPRTPPPKTPRRHHADNDEESKRAGKEGADLLLYLAASPSPAVRGDKPSSTPFGLSTPPTKNTPLPSSILSTPGFFSSAFNPVTPGTGFNFSDFVNITPSPAQLPWSKTPANAKTPRVALEARRRLNFDGLFSPNVGVDSPKIGMRKGSTAKQGAGLGMELGGELLNSKSS